MEALPPTTTVEENLHSSSQRRVNIIWEITQAIIALSVITAIIFCSISKIESESLVNMGYLVVGFYFGRTNHEKVGGVNLGR